MDQMERATLRRYATGVVPLAVFSVLLLAALFLMSIATQSSTLLGPLYSVFLVISIFGILLLLGLILVSLIRLAVQFRARVMGSRLTLRLLGMFAVLAVAPVAIVLLFSLQVVNRGIDSWFDVRTEKALDDALLVGRSALDAIKQELLKNAKSMAVELEGSPDKLAVPALDFLRDKYSISELTLFSQDGRIIASSSDAGPGTATLVPDRPSDAILSQARQGQAYANLDAIRKGDLQLRVVVPVYDREVGASVRLLQILQPLPTRYAELSQSVQTAFAEYQKLIYLRGPLKFGFTLTLGLVALLTILIAAWAAIFSARRLAAPIRDLAAGTRAVADGDYGKQLPVQGKDEFGILVQSFNDMTRKIRDAQDQIKRSRAEAEMQGTYLQTVLTHLSSGVLSFDGRNCLRTHNAAAAQILRIDLGPATGKSLDWIANSHPGLGAFCEAVRTATEGGRNEWQAEITLPGQAGKRTLILRGTMLPGPRRGRGGFVLVFDDVTARIQVERDAAWREVARRLAHEIKNPLTPIQLSAERIRHKCMSALAATEQRTLDRATHTIIEQVEALKSMVNAFSDYARPVQMQTGLMDLNRLIRDVVELYGADVVDLANSAPAAKRPRAARGKGSKLRSKRLTVELDLGADVPAIHADAGRLRQVLHNLLLNARDALAEHAQPLIRIHTRHVAHEDSSSVQLAIEDNGPGIPAALMDHLFEPYVTSREKGTGLGLAIVKRIIEEHNGALVAENFNGGGARISITLPTDQTLSQQAQTPAGLAVSRKQRA
jgi:two-component system, NtrC family, nitrogen regulation sensor histidine kinase NtrY